MYELMKRLFPICRSITGDGVRETLGIIKEYIPINIIEVSSGTKAFDWEVPKEWNICDAFIKDKSGKKVIDFNENNLHVVGYSKPFSGTVSLDELKKHIFTLPDHPDWIPYITSYYSSMWGFCMRHKDFMELSDGYYEVNISSSLKPGSMTYADLVIKGESEKEILLSTNICHPSMANNELSGLVLLTHLAQELLKRKKLRYTYRFIFVPETIGSITYISKNFNHLKNNVIAGYAAVCVGDPGNFSYTKSKKKNSLTNRVTEHVLNNSNIEYNLYDFTRRSSDERQFGWPGVDIDVGSLMRTKPSLYPEYHSSADNLMFVTADALEGSFEMYMKCINAFENNLVFENTIICEPLLGKRGLYPMVSTKDTINKVIDMKNILAYCDGEIDLIGVADQIGLDIDKASEIAEKLVKYKLLRVKK